MEQISHTEPCRWTYRVHLFSTSRELSTLWLPEQASGFYRFPEEIYQFVHLQGSEGKWTACCQEPALFRGAAGERYQEVPLEDSNLVKLEYDGTQMYLFEEKITRIRLTYQHYNLHSETQLRIGSAPDCELRFRSDLIPAYCVVLTHSNKQWTLSQLNPGAMLYVNGRRACEGAAELGDALSMLGLHVILGPKSISVNTGDERITLKPEIIKISFNFRNHYNQNQGVLSEEREDVFFNRLPRKYLCSKRKTITLEAPPMSLSRGEIPLLLRMGGSMVMGGQSALAGNFASMISSVLFPILTSRFTETQRKEYEQRRTERYTAYLNHQRECIRQICRDEEHLQNVIYPAINRMMETSRNGSGIWERRPGDEDFLVIRLGYGNRPAEALVDYPTRHFELEKDELVEQMYQLAEEPRILHDVPVTLSLQEDRVSGFIGCRSKLLKLANQILLQLVLRHSYDEVKIIFLAPAEEMKHFYQLRYLPHVWDDQHAVRFLATNEVEASVLSEYFRNQLPDEKPGKNKIPGDEVHYVVFALDRTLLNSAETLKMLLRSDNAKHFSFLAIYDELPKECTQVVTLEENGNCVVEAMNSGEEDTEFTMDTCDMKAGLEIQERLSNLLLKTVSMDRQLPKMVTFMEMFRAGNLDQLNPVKRWKESDPIQSLAAPVGIHTDGSLFMLDLHEKRQGPHGLIAGMTGSGKSEFIITYILSMALCYHPDEVSFILIDYKGGGLAGAFDNPRTGLRLPHLVGTITNLDGAEINRSLMSIESELLRRQKLFNKVKERMNEGTLDIYGYQKLYRAGKVSEPVPHLFIISDEFAELKIQQPDFMDKLNSTARIGRSLGVHLILATQKPSGVVDEQIRSNSKFRVCLRVQDRTDSVDMLRRDDAAELRDTGRFYLQVGYNEYFALGQSAWCGAPYEEQECALVKKDDEVEFLGTNGQILARKRPQHVGNVKNIKQIVAVVGCLAQAADSIGFRPRNLWKPAMPVKLAWDDHAQLSRLQLPLGLIDDPEQQSQYPMILDLAKNQHLLIAGEAQTGKTTLVQNILRSLVLRNSPSQINFYILDYSSRSLKRFSNLPHCGAVLLEENSNLLNEFFKLIDGIIMERKQLFSRLGIESWDAALEYGPLPLVLVVIDNIAGLNLSRAGEGILYDMSRYLKGSTAYGIRFIITCSSLNEISNRIKQELGIRLSLHMGDKYSYEDLLGCRIHHFPPELPGRGLVLREERPLEMQLAMFMPDIDDAERNRLLDQELSTVRNRYRDAVPIRHMPVFSETVEYSEFSAQFSRGRIPLGISRATSKPVALPLRQFSSLSVYIGNPHGTVPLMENFLYAARRDGMTPWIIPSREDSCLNRLNQDLLRDTRILDSSVGAIPDLVETLRAELAVRRTKLDAFIEEKNLPPEAVEELDITFPWMRQELKPIMLFIEHFSELCSSAELLDALYLGKYLGKAYRRAIYVIAFYRPGDPPCGSINSLYYGFNPEENIMLFGGRLNQQPLCELEDTMAGKMLPYNICLMKYRGDYYPLLMPCGEIEDQQEDPDMQKIF